MLTKFGFLNELAGDPMPTYGVEVIVPTMLTLSVMLRRFEEENPEIDCTYDIGYVDARNVSGGSLSSVIVRFSDLNTATLFKLRFG